MKLSAHFSMKDNYQQTSLRHLDALPGPLMSLFLGYSDCGLYGWAQQIGKLWRLISVNSAIWVVASKKFPKKLFLPSFCANRSQMEYRWNAIVSNQYKKILSENWRFLWLQSLGYFKTQCRGFDLIHKPALCKRRTGDVSICPRFVLRVKLLLLLLHLWKQPFYMDFVTYLCISKEITFPAGLWEQLENLGMLTQTNWDL